MSKKTKKEQTKQQQFHNKIKWSVLFGSIVCIFAAMIGIFATVTDNFTHKIGEEIAIKEDVKETPTFDVSKVGDQFNFIHCDLSSQIDWDELLDGVESTISYDNGTRLTSYCLLRCGSGLEMGVVEENEDRDSVRREIYICIGDTMIYEEGIGWLQQGIQALYDFNQLSTITYIANPEILAKYMGFFYVV